MKKSPKMPSKSPGPVAAPKMPCKKTPAKKIVPAVATPKTPGNRTPAKIMPAVVDTSAVSPLSDVCQGSSYRPPPDPDAGSPTLRGWSTAPASPSHRSAGGESRPLSVQREDLPSQPARRLDGSSPSRCSDERRSSNSNDRRSRVDTPSLSASGSSGEKQAKKKPRQEHRPSTSHHHRRSWSGSRSASRSTEKRHRSSRPTAVTGPVTLDPATLAAIEAIMHMLLKAQAPPQVPQQPRNAPVHPRDPLRSGGSTS